MNTLSRMEIRVLLDLEEEKNVTELAKELGLSIYRASTLVSSLERKGLIRAKKGKKKIVLLNDTKPGELFRKIVSSFGHMPLDKVLSGKNLLLLAVLENVPSSPKELYIKASLPRSTLYHTINRLSNYGIIIGKNGKYSLLERYMLFHEFAKEFYDVQNSIKAREFSRDSAIVWSGVKEFILSTKKYKGKDVGNLHLTGLERFSDFGVELIGTGRYHYYYSEKAELSLEDVVMHALLIDFSPRTILYSIVLLLAFRDKLNRNKLLNLGKKYGVSIEGLLAYLEGKEAGRYPYPSLKEVEETFEMYFGEKYGQYGRSNSRKADI